MANVIQTKKKRDKKKKKEDGTEEFVFHQSTTPTPEDDLNIHIHKEATTGGGLCAKLVFFVLLTLLSTLIGLLITEHRGLTDLDTINTESAFARIFDGWIDQTPEVHEETYSVEESLEEDVEASHSQEDEEQDQIDVSEEQELSKTESEEPVDDEEEYQQNLDEDEDEPEETETQEYSTNDDDEVSSETAETKDETLEESKVSASVISREEPDEDEDKTFHEELNQRLLEKSRETLSTRNEISQLRNDQNVDEIEVSRSERQDAEEVDLKNEEENENLIPDSATDETEKPASNSETVKPLTKDSDSEDENWSNKHLGPNSVYDFSNITNVDDMKIREELDRAEQNLANDAAFALTLFNNILEKSPLSPRAFYGKARSLDALAERKKSNKLLDEAIIAYHQVLKLKDVPDALFQMVAERCINRARFRGVYNQAVPVHKLLIGRFPKNVHFQNELAVTYLTMNNFYEAKKVLYDILSKWPLNGFAMVNYGFILKLYDLDLKQAVKYLKRGIETRDRGVIDGRFFYHLGDALLRLGRKDEAMAVHIDGVNNKVFLSKYQRSLHNVNRLLGKPWWKKEDIPNTQFFVKLEQNWKVIRDEGIQLLNTDGLFKTETEDLREVGDWKQFELYARGIKNVKNCRECPKTCRLIESFPDAVGCKRGQIKFSVVQPGTHVWPHCGPTNCRLRSHLGLKVPSNVFIRVANEIRSWEEGKLLIFDDSFEHEIWHNGSSTRLILIVDFWHPQLTKEEKRTLSSV